MTGRSGKVLTPLAGDMLLVFTVHFKHLFKVDDACDF